MRVLRLIMVGAFLLSIAIADNGNSMRLHSRNGRHQRRFAPTNRRTLRLPPKINYLPQHKHRDAPFVASPSDENVSDKNSYSDHRHNDQERKSRYQSDNMMILEPVEQSRKSSWADWIPDFFGDDPPKGPGMLIGPIDFPGISRELYIRHKEPLDDDTNHVVIHVVNREPPSQADQVSRHSQATLLSPQSNHIDSSRKDHFHHSDSSEISSSNLPPDLDYEKSEYSSKTKDGNPWNDSLDAEVQTPNGKAQSKLSVALLEHSRSGSPNIIWSRPVDRKININSRSMDLVSSEINSPLEKSPKSGGSPLKASIPIPTVSAASKASKPRRRYVNPDDTRASSESIRPAALPQRNRFTDEILRLSTPANHLDEITTDDQTLSEGLPANHAIAATPASTDVHNNSFAKASVRTPRNPNSTIHSSEENISTPRQTIKHPQGALRVVPAPNLKDSQMKGISNREKRVNNTKGEEIMQRIMTMTSETWKEDDYSSTNRIDSDDESDGPLETETQNIERRMDLDVSLEDKNNEAEVDTKEAVKKMMSTFSLWRHKAVSTKFVKELDEKEKKRKKT